MIATLIQTRLSREEELISIRHDLQASTLCL